MLKFNKNEVRSFLIVVIFVVIAYSLRRMSFTTPFIGCFQLLLHSFIYATIFFVWSVKSFRSISHTNTRNGVLSVGIMMLFWFACRTIKYYFIYDEVTARMLWYLYYIPICFIPTLTYFVTMVMDKNENERIKASSYVPFAVATVLSIFAITNDFHQLFFNFNDLQVWSENDYSYGIMYYLTILWIAICIIASFVNLIKKSRVLKVKAYVLLPIAPIILLGIYSLLYVFGSPIISSKLYDVCIVSCLCVIMSYSGLFKIGLIRVNSRYYDLFNASVNTSAQIVDNNFKVRHSANNSLAINDSQIRQAQQGDVRLSKSTFLKSSPISGGYVVWVEDVSEQIELRETLEELQQELKDRNNLLKLQYEKDKERTAIEEQNRIYDLLQKNTQSQIDKISILVSNYKNTSQLEDKNILLCQIAVLCSYIKRRKHLTLSTYNAQSISPIELENAFKESLKTLGLLGVRYNYYIDFSADSIDGSIATTAYDFYENVIEVCLDSIDTIMVSISSIDGVLRITLNINCESDLSPISKLYPNALIDDSFEDGCFIVLPLENGGVANV